MTQLEQTDLADTRLGLDGVTLVAVDSAYLDRTVRALRHCQRQARFRDAFLLTDHAPRLPSEIESVAIPRLDSLAAYSRFMLYDLPAHLDRFASHLLVVQHDGFILDPGAWREEFLNYDYVGAPWADGCVGNGGFSLRSRRLLAALRELRPEIGECHPEDEVLCRRLRPRLEAAGVRFAPTAVAAAFSAENRPSAGSFGYHGRLTERLNGFSVEDTPGGEEPPGTRLA